jgi:hypothetical protein
MLTPDRREFQPREDFFKGFRTEQIKTSDATINTVYGGNRNSSPLLLLHGHMCPLKLPP